MELGSGHLYSWTAALGQLVYQPGRLEAASVLSREAMPAGDSFWEDLWDFALQLLDKDPDRRPSMAIVQLSEFFTSDKYALSSSSTPTDRKFRALSSHLDAMQHSMSRLPACCIDVASEETVAHDMLSAFSAAATDMSQAVYISWGPAKIRKPLQEVMDLLFVHLSQQQGFSALFQQCDEPAQMLRSFLPPCTEQLPAQLQAQYTALGRILAKCLLEGIHVPLNLSAALHCMLVREEAIQQQADACIGMLSDYDPDEANRLRQLLALRHGNGEELLVSVGSVLGSDEESLVTDANKEDLARQKVMHMMLWQCFVATIDGFSHFAKTHCHSALTGRDSSLAAEHVLRPYTERRATKSMYSSAG